MGQIADMENLRLAYWKAKRGKCAQREVLAFSVPSLDANLLQLREQMLNGTIEVESYRFFKIFDPKERQICAAPFPQRVLHHAIMTVCHDDFERRQIFDSYASRKGKGTYAALERAWAFQKKCRYCMKLDVRKFFDSIDHSVLQDQLKRMYKDEALLHLLSRIIDGYHSSSGRGLPIGNLISQYLANHYLSVLDHYAKEVLGVKAYVRYMDDIMVWDNDWAHLKGLGVRLRDFLQDQLHLSLKVMQLRPTCQFTTFLGYRLSSCSMLLSQRSAMRYKRHIKELYHEYDTGQIDQRLMQQRLLPILSFVEKVPSKVVRLQSMDQCV